MEDDPDVRWATVRVLQKAGYEVVEAATGEEGLAQVREQSPQLVLLDVNLPGIDGLEVCRRIKADPVLADIFVVHCSAAQTDETAVAAGLEAGADGYITRPLDARELVARVRAFFRHKETIDRLRTMERLRGLQFDQEMAYFAQLAAGGLRVTARSLGIPPLQEAAPEVFASLVRTYGEILDTALAQHIYKSEDRPSPALRVLAEQLYTYTAGPRDVTELHYAAIKTRTEQGARAPAMALLEAGRLTVLELMGQLTATYRNHQVTAFVRGANRSDPTP